MGGKGEEEESEKESLTSNMPNTDYYYYYSKFDKSFKTYFNAMGLQCERSNHINSNTFYTSFSFWKLPKTNEARTFRHLGITVRHFE